MALPLMIEKKAFPNRDMIIFLTFSVIFATLVFQGMTIRKLIKWLGIKEDGQQLREEQEARLKIAFSIIEHIEENYSLSLSDAVLNQIKTKYEIRVQRMRKDQTEQKLTEDQINEFHRIQQDLIDHERQFVSLMRKDGKLSDEASRKIEYELDLEEARLALEREN